MVVVVLMMVKWRWLCSDGANGVESLCKGGSCNRYRSTIIVKVSGG